jgi:hypothetical protein
LPYALCWESPTEYRAMPDDGAAMRRLVLDGLEIIAPVVDGQGRDRAKAAVRLVAQILRRLHPDIDGSVDRRLDAFVELAVALIDEDYGSAFGRFAHLVGDFADDKVEYKFKRFAGLIGAVASYAAVYRSTKDEDPTVARDARKRALSAIIDSFTNRTEREEVRLWSLGSNVGVGFTPLTGLDDDDGDERDRWSPSVRVPLGVRYEWLPSNKKRFKDFGLFGGVQLVDLGLFVRKDEDGTLAPIEWSDFVAPGLEVGVSHAFFSRPLNLTAHLTYAPSHDDGDGARSGVWRFGFGLAYYVPFLDLD